MILAGLSAKLFYDWHTAENQFETAQKILTEKSESAVLKKTLDAEVAEMKKINSLLAAQSENSSKLNALIRLGKISGGSIQLKKINASEDFTQIEGTAENPDALEKYLARLKNSVASTVKLANTAATDDGKLNFTIRLSFKNLSE